MNEHKRFQEKINELEEQLDKYFRFTIKVYQILTSLNLYKKEQINAILLTYAKMIWPDLWDEKRQAQLKELEDRI